jgi:hypothetical protein
MSTKEEDGMELDAVELILGGSELFRLKAAEPRAFRRP